MCEYSLHVRVLVLGKSLQLSIMFADETGAYTNDRVGSSPCPQTLYRVEMVARDRNASLLRIFVYYGR
jgi:hypothetical protein